MILIDATPEEAARQVFETGSSEEGFLAHMLAQGRENHETYQPRGLEPVAFVFAEAQRSLPVVSLAHLWDSVAARDEAAEFLRMYAAKVDATILAVMSDCWRTNFTTNKEDIVAAGLDPLRWRDWPPATRRRFPVVRREALMMTIDSRLGPKVLSQFYARDCGRILWEELRVDDDYTSAEASFIGLLPRKGQPS